MALRNERPYNITYLLGAGASANAIPVVNQMDYHFNAFIDFIQTNTPSLNIRFQIAAEKHINAARRHFSIDTYAKKLYLNRKTQELRELKHVLNAYFEYEQRSSVDRDLELNINEEQFDPKGVLSLDEKKKFMDRFNSIVDYRYDAFLATVLEHSTENFNVFPENISIISWNYDYQLEIALSEYFEHYIRNIRHQYDIYPRNNFDITQDHIKPKIVKLNGSTGIYGRFEDGKFIKFEEPNLSRNEPHYAIVKQCEQHYIQFIRDESNEAIIPMINFAWEEDNPHVEYGIKKARNIFSGTDILVIIGYSFPNFNRSIDRKLFSQSNNLQKVYFQSSPDSKVAIKENILSAFDKTLKEENIIYKSDLSQFFIPPEFYYNYRLPGISI